MRDRADPHARKRAFEIGRQERPSGLLPKAADLSIGEVPDSIAAPSAHPMTRQRQPVRPAGRASTSRTEQENYRFLRCGRTSAQIPSARYHS